MYDNRDRYFKTNISSSISQLIENTVKEYV